MAHPTRCHCGRQWRIAIAVALLAPLPAGAQVLYGSIVGTVVDAQGAGIPGATVSATNTGTGLKVSAPSPTADGAYRSATCCREPTTSPSRSRASASCNQTGLRVSPGNPVRIDLKLEVGALAESVNVVSETTLLQTEKADLISELTLEGDRQPPAQPVPQLPDADRTWCRARRPAQFQNAEIDTPGRSLRTWVNGMQPNSNATRIDGAVSVNIWLPHHVGYVAPAETIETVNVSTNNFDADQGMAGGAATTVVTKSGTNQLHGSAFWFCNSESLNANTLFNNACGLPEAGPQRPEHLRRAHSAGRS